MGDLQPFDQHISKSCSEKASCSLCIYWNSNLLLTNYFTEQLLCSGIKDDGHQITQDEGKDGTDCAS